jgi:hypothetical protein
VLGVVPPIAPGLGRELVDAPRDTALPAIVIDELARLPFVIELEVVRQVAQATAPVVALTVMGAVPVVATVPDVFGHRIVGVPAAA